MTELLTQWAALPLSAPRPSQAEAFLVNPTVVFSAVNTFYHLDPCLIFNILLFFDTT